MLLVGELAACQQVAGAFEVAVLGMGRAVQRHAALDDSGGERPISVGQSVQLSSSTTSARSTASTVPAGR
ncbi:MAG: hypothetical protein ACLSVD_08995 [Eggerthellaceae bacterium]